MESRQLLREFDAPSRVFDVVPVNPKEDAVAVEGQVLAAQTIHKELLHRLGQNGPAHAFVVHFDVEISVEFPPLGSDVVVSQTEEALRLDVHERKRPGKRITQNGARFRPIVLTGAFRPCRRSSRFCRSYANPRAPKSTTTAIITITMGMVSLISRSDARFTIHLPGRHFLEEEALANEQALART